MGSDCVMGRCVICGKETGARVSLDNTLIYINLEQAVFAESNTQEFHVKVARNLEEACELVKVGFDYVCEMEDAKLFRKRK